MRYCPKCRAEYRHEVEICSDCEIALVSELPPAEEESSQDLVPIFDTADVSLLPVVKSVLSAAGIPFLVQGDEALGVLPIGRVGVGGISASGHGLAATIHVPRSWEEEARLVLADIGEGDPEES